MRNRRSGGKPNHGTGDRADRAKHHGARYGAEGGVATAPLGPARCRRKRQKNERREKKSLHSGFPPRIQMKHVAPELRLNQGTILAGYRTAAE
jgi:hypothetical protein